jgi:hypothetical protein
MKKIILALTLGVCSIGVANADVFMGATYGTSWSNVENAKETNNINANEDFSESLRNAETWGFRVGGDFETIRVYGTYEYASKNDKGGNNHQENYILSTDYLYRVSPNTRLFAGLSAGGNRMVNESTSRNGYDYDTYSFTYGGQMGFLYNFDKNLEVEGAYRYLRNENADNKGDGTNDTSPLLKDTLQLYMALNYHFN